MKLIYFYAALLTLTSGCTSYGPRVTDKPIVADQTRIPASVTQVACNLNKEKNNVEAIKIEGGVATQTFSITDPLPTLRHQAAAIMSCERALNFYRAKIDLSKRDRVGCESDRKYYNAWIRKYSGSEQVKGEYIYLGDLEFPDEDIKILEHSVCSKVINYLGSL